MKLGIGFAESRQQTTEIDDASLARLLDILYNRTATNVASEPASDTSDLSTIRATYKNLQEFEENYQSQINKVCDKLSELCTNDAFPKGAEQFTILKNNSAFNSEIAYSENETSSYKIQDSLKARLEQIYYHMQKSLESQESSTNQIRNFIPSSVKSAITNSEFSKCLAGAFTNIEDVIRKFDGELYSYKYDFIRNYASEYIQSNKLTGKGNEVHYANELLYFTSLKNQGGNSAQVNYNLIVPTDLYARYPSLETAISSDDFADHRKFAFKVNELLQSPDGANLFTEFVANNVMLNLPDQPTQDQNTSSLSQKEIEQNVRDYLTIVKAALQPIDLDEKEVLNYDDDKNAWSYADNYQERIKIGTADYLSTLSIDQQTVLEKLKIQFDGQDKEIKQTSAGYYIQSDIANPLSDYQEHYLKLLDTSLTSDLTVDNKKLLSFIEEKIIDAYNNPNPEDMNKNLATRFYNIVGLAQAADAYDQFELVYESQDSKGSEEDQKDKLLEIIDELNKVSARDLLAKTDIYQKLNSQPYDLNLADFDSLKPTDLLKMQPYLDTEVLTGNEIFQNAFNYFKTNRDFDGLAFVVKNFNGHNDSAESTFNLMVRKSIYDNNVSVIKYLLSSENATTLMDQKLKNDLFLKCLRENKLEILEDLIDLGIDVNLENNDGKTALMMAAGLGKTEIVKVLLEKEGINVNLRDNDGITALMIGAESGNTETVKVLLEKEGIDVNLKNKDGKTALMIATESGHSETVKVLLEKEGIDFNLQDKDGKTALMMGAWSGNTEIANSLLARGADVNLKNKDGRTALIMSAYRGHSETVKVLLPRVEDVNLQDEDGITALMMAVRSGKTETVNVLLEKGADVNLKNKSGITALMIAAQFDNTENVKVLLAIVEDVNLKNKDGKTALMMGAQFGKTENVKVLLEKEGIDFNLQDKDGKTALMMGAGGGHGETVKVLLEKEGIDFNLQDKDGKTALMMGAWSGNTEIAEALVTRGADVNLKNKDGITALMTAAESGETETVKVLLEKEGVDFNLQDKDGKTALMMGAGGGHSATVKVLLEKEGIDFNLQDKDGKTALMMGAWSGNTEIAEALVTRGADVNLQNSDGNTALMMGAGGGHSATVKVLLEKEEIDVNLKNKDGITALMTAAESGETETVNVLLEKEGIDVNLKNKDRKTALMIAAERGHTETVEAIRAHLQKKVQNNQVFPQSYADRVIASRSQDPNNKTNLR